MDRADGKGAETLGAASPISIADLPSYRTLVRERSRLAWLLTGIILVVYFGYILLIAFNRDVLAQPIAGGTMTLGIPVGIGVILTGIALTAAYVHRANRRFDALTQAIRDEAAR